MRTFPVRTCEGCGKKYSGPGLRYCSWRCYSDSRWVTRICEWCGKEFRARAIYVARGQMRYCSAECGQQASRKHPVVEYQGDTFYLTVQGYFCSWKTQKFLHRAIWEDTHGSIPQGCVVHHVDGDKRNNLIDNLQLLKWGEHTSRHDKANPRLPKRPKTYCKADGCERVARARGLCTLHYQRLKAMERVIGREGRPKD
jgi:hypothetical protein